jgi:hypothetical protein
MQDVVATPSIPMSTLDAKCEKASINAINNTLKHLSSNQQKQLKAQCNSGLQRIKGNILVRLNPLSSE